VLALGAGLVAIGAIGTVKRTSVIHGAISRPIANETHAGLTVSDVYKRDGPGVAYVQTATGQGGEQATGSGFVIDKRGHVLTNAHVVNGATSVTVQLGNRTWNAKIVGRNESTDVALLDVSAPARYLHPLALADSNAVQVGDSVVAIGNPFGLDRTVTTGIVSALQRRIQGPNGSTISNAIQTDTAINPGNSGGPLIDSSGRVIGITSQIEAAGGRGSVGIGFAVPMNTAKKIVGQLERYPAV
jgi:S1-C subfamily serine protease